MIGRLLCKLNIHSYKPVGQPTKANGLNGQLILKTHLVCSRCGETKLQVAKRLS